MKLRKLTQWICLPVVAVAALPGCGSDPQILFDIQSEPAGPNCAYSGLKILSGADVNNPALYTGNVWTTAARLNRLAVQNPAPYDLAEDLLNDANLRANAAAAGVVPNLFVANPDKLGGAFLTRNEGFTDYHSLQVELRRRLAQGLQFQSSYVFGKAMTSTFLSFRAPLVSRRDTGTPGDLTQRPLCSIGTNGTLYAGDDHDLP